MPWSVIVKAFGPPAGPAGGWSDGRREASAYLSGLLPAGACGIAAPRCYGATSREDGSLWLWLEDLQDDVWTPETFMSAAYTLGRWNAGPGVPRDELTSQWCSVNWLRDLVQSNSAGVESLASAARNPLLRRVYPEPNVRRLLALWENRDRLLVVLESLPQSFAHLDAFRRNLMVRRDADGLETFTAVDWAFCGWAAAGEELAGLVYASLAFLELPRDRIQELEAGLLARYVQGLRDGGWSGGEETVRFALHAAGSLRYTIGVLQQMIAALCDENLHPRMEELMGAPIEEVAGAWAVLIDHLLTVGESALEHLEQESPEPA